VRRDAWTPGVLILNSYGGFVKQFEVALNPERLRAMNLALTDIFDASNATMKYRQCLHRQKSNRLFHQGIGQVKTLEDIEKIVVKTNPSEFPF